MNMQGDGDFLGQYIDALVALPGLTVERMRRDFDQGGKHFDAVIDVLQGERAAQLFVEIRANGYPRDVRAAADHLCSLTGGAQASYIPVVISFSISETSRDWLKSNEIGYWDSGGSLYLPLLPSIYLIDRPPPKGHPRLSVDLFHGRAEQVLHCMLLDPGRAWTIKDLAREAGVTPSTAHQTLLAMEKEWWIEKRGAGPATRRKLRDPSAVLDAWKQRYSLRRYAFHRFYRWSREGFDDQLKTVAECFKQIDRQYALTLSAGAAFVAPFVTAIPVVALIAPRDVELSSILPGAGYEPVDEGENLLVLTAPDDSPMMFRQQINDYWIASNIQLYLDLSSSPQRGKEQAEHLRQLRIGF